MFNIGFGELAIICIVLIIAVGPERLPSMMKTLGKTIRTLRQASRDIRASTGIDELLREDFDLYAPPPPRRPAPASIPPDQPAAVPEPAAQAPALAAGAEGQVPALAAGSDGQAQAPVAAPEPKPISREDVIEAEHEPRASVAPASPAATPDAPAPPVVVVPAPVVIAAEPAAPPAPKAPVAAAAPAAPAPPGSGEGALSQSDSGAGKPSPADPSRGDGR